MEDEGSIDKVKRKRVRKKKLGEKKNKKIERLRDMEKSKEIEKSIERNIINIERERKRETLLN